MSDTPKGDHTDAKPEGPYIVWTDYGGGGWSPASYPTLAAALDAPRYGHQMMLTKVVRYEVVETDAL